MTDETLEKRLYQLTDRVEEYEQRSAEKFYKLIEAQKTNTEAISRLTESVSSLVQDTSSIIQLQKDFQGAARVGKGLQNFMLWCLKWGVIGTGVVTMINWLIERFYH